MSSFRGNATFQTLRKGSVIKCSLGSYEVLSHLARGRVCATHVGKNEPPKAFAPLYVAVKFFSRHQDYRGALERELMVLEALAGDKHIVHQLCEKPTCSTGNDVLVLELLSGTADSVLPDFISDDTCPSAWLLHTLATHTVKGLQSLHRAGFVHGDIKLQNVMWCSDRSSFVLIDFGLSSRENERYCFQVHSKGCSAPEVVKWNALVQSESLADLKSADLDRPGQPADVWALGCTLLKAVAGVSAFPGGAPLEQNVVDDVLEFLFRKAASRYSSEFYDDFQRFIKMCLRVAPAERATATELRWMQWQEAGRPSYNDMLTLPCRLLRLQNVCDPGTETLDVTPLIAECCSKYGRVIKSKFSPQDGVIYLLFKHCLDAETAFQMMQRKLWRGRNLIPMFYPAQDLNHVD